MPQGPKPGPSARVILQDFTGVPAIVDLAAMREAVVRMTDDPESAQKVNPQVPCDLVIDHSVQVDSFANPNALRLNSRMEFERNKERYQFLKWGRGRGCELVFGYLAGPTGLRIFYIRY